MSYRWAIVIVLVLMAGMMFGAAINKIKNPPPEPEYIVITRQNFSDGRFACQHVYMDGSLAGTTCYKNKSERPALWAPMPVAEPWE